MVDLPLQANHEPSEVLLPEALQDYEAGMAVFYSELVSLHVNIGIMERKPILQSESRRNYAAPLSLWTWSKVVHALALRAGVPQFSTHTLRHLCLTDLARAGWELHVIATFAGHRNPATAVPQRHPIPPCWRVGERVVREEQVWAVRRVRVTTLGTAGHAID